jgi:hypothetical protein
MSGRGRWISRRSIGITLVEVLVALAVMSTLMLPIGMFMLEYLRGSSELGDSHQVMNLLEERLETALAQPYDTLPVGETSGKRLNWQDERGLDLRPVQVGHEQVHFFLTVEVVPVEFSAVADPRGGRMERARLEDGFKRLVLQARWGRKQEHRLELLAFKADL